MTDVTLDVKNPVVPSKMARGKFLVDSGAQYTVLSPEMVNKLGLKALDEQEFSLADRSVIKRKMSEAKVRFGRRERTVPVILGEVNDTQLLGVTTLEVLGYVLNPLDRTIHEYELMPW